MKSEFNSEMEGFIMNEIILIILGIIAFIISLAMLYSMPRAFLKEFEKNCHEFIKREIIRRINNES